MTRMVATSFYEDGPYYMVEKIFFFEDSRPRAKAWSSSFPKTPNEKIILQSRAPLVNSLLPFGLTKCPILLYSQTFLVRLQRIHAKIYGNFLASHKWRFNAISYECLRRPCCSSVLKLFSHAWSPCTHNFKNILWCSCMVPLSSCHFPLPSNTEACLSTVRLLWSCPDFQMNNTLLVFI